MAGPDILDGAPVTPRGRRPRWQLLAGALVLAGVAAVLAGRSDPDPPPAPVPAPTAAAVPVPRPPAVVSSVAIGVRSAYVLMAQCDEAAVRACELRLFRRPLGPVGARWTGLPLRFEMRSTSGLIPWVVVDGEDTPVVLDEGQTWAFVPSGGSFARRRLDIGPGVDRVPPGGLLLAGLCSRCGQRLVVLDAAAGALRPLIAQPPLNGRSIRSHDHAGDTVWALAGDEGPGVGAVSTDAGRSWRRMAVPGTEGDGLQVVATADGGAYLVGTRRDELGNSRLAGIWRSTPAGGEWRRLRPTTVPTSVRSMLGGERSLLIVDHDGLSWRLGPDGTVGRLPDPGPNRPDLLLDERGGLVVGLLRVERADRLLLISADEGQSWQVEQIPE